MLKLFRKKAVTKVILWGLLILILPAFVMWGSASMSRSKEKGPTYVGIINNKKVSFEDFYQALTGVRSQIILNYFNQPKVLESLLGNKTLMAKLAWDRLLMINEAKTEKIKISDKEVIDYIRSHPLFTRDGIFDERAYSILLRNNIGLEPRAFEETVRESIAVQKLGAVLTKDVKVSDEEAMEEFKKEMAETATGKQSAEKKEIKEPKKPVQTDQEKFNTDKENYIQRVREQKSNVIMEQWLRGLESKAQLAIKFEEIDKYYR